jgi:glycosyltransferase involved in cell wall biosynthesis
MLLRAGPLSFLFEPIALRPWPDQVEALVPDEPPGRAERLARLAAGDPAAKAVAWIGGQGVPALAGAGPADSAPAVVIVEPSGLAPAEVAQALETPLLAARPDGPARWLWLIGNVGESQPFEALAAQFDFVFAAELEVALDLARRLGPGRAGLAPLPAGSAASAADGAGVADAYDQSSETRLDPELLTRLMADGRAEAAYSRANWNFFGAIGPLVEADPAAVASEHSWAARFGQMIGQAVGRPAAGEPWAEIGRQIAEAAAEQPEASGFDWEILPQAWPQGQSEIGGGHLYARRQGDDLEWEVKSAPGANYSLDLPGTLPVAKASADGRNVYIRLSGSGSVEGQFCLAFADRLGRILQSRWYAWNRLHTVAVPPGAKRLRLSLRARGDGLARFTALRVSDRGEPCALPLRWSPRRVLLLADGYPSPENLYSFGFVHTRVTRYLAAGFDVDVMVAGPDRAKSWREHEGVQILEGPNELLRRMLESGRYGAVAVHFLRPNLWEALADFADRLPMTIWIHGGDIQPWWRQKHLIDSARQQAWLEDRTKRLTAMWRSVFTAPGSLARFVFVSGTFAGEVAEDMAKLGVEFPGERASVINNGIDVDLFKYHEKPPELRKRIMMVRTFATRKYGTDLAARAIESLAAKPYFDELSFLIVGDGALWEEDMGPLQRFANVKLERRFMTHRELARVQRDFGVMLQPTRWDSQGVSRDEAMAAGLVVISNAAGAVPEFMSDAEGYLAPPDDWRGIAAAIDEIYRRPEVFARKSRAAAGRARANLDLARVIDREIELIGRTVGGR